MPLHVPLPFQFPLGLAQRRHVIDGLAAQRPPDRALVDVVQSCARVVLAQRRLQVSQVSQVGERGGGVTQAQRLVAGHRVFAPAGQVHVGPAGPEQVGQPGHFRGQARVLQGLVHQPGQLITLAIGERLKQPLRRLGPADQRVDQFLQIARVVREQVPVGVHEAVEVLGGVLAPGVGFQHPVEVGEHVLDPLHGFGVGPLQHVFHAAELAIKHLAAEQVLEPLEGLPGRRGAPGVVSQPPDRLRGVRRQRVELGLTQPGFVAGVGEEFRPLLADGRVEQRASLVQDAVEAAPAAHLPLPLTHPPQHVVQAAVVSHAAAQQITQRASRVRAAEHRVAELVQRATGVIRRGQRIRPVVVLAVPVTSHACPASVLRCRLLTCGRQHLRRRSPWTAAASGTALRGRTPGPRPRARTTRHRRPCPAVP